MTSIACWRRRTGNPPGRRRRRTGFICNGLRSRNSRYKRHIFAICPAKIRIGHQSSPGPPDGPQLAGGPRGRTTGPKEDWVMSNTATAPAEKPATAKLIAPLTESIKHLKVALEKGTNIKALRIRNGDELDTARGNKLEWTQNCTDLLAQLFDNTTVADYYNDW